MAYKTRNNYSKFQIILYPPLAINLLINSNNDTYLEIFKRLDYWGLPFEFWLFNVKSLKIVFFLLSMCLICTILYGIWVDD